MRMYYFRLGNDVIGPMSLDDLRKFVSAGNVQSDTPVGFGPNGPWVPAAQVGGLSDPVESKTHTRSEGVPFSAASSRQDTHSKRFYFRSTDGRVTGRAGDEIVGPMTGIELRNAALAEEVVPMTLVATNADGPWHPAKRVRGLFDDEGRPLPHPPEMRRPVQEEPPRVPSVPSAADVVVPESQKGLTPHINPNNTSSAAFAERQKEMAPPPPRWWADCDGESQGPLDFSQVTAFLQSQKLRTSSLVCLEGTQEWQPISECPEFQVAIGSMLPPVESLPPRGGALVGQTSQKEAVRDEIREIAVRQRRLIIGIGLMCLGHFFGIVMINVAATVVAVSVGVEPDDPVLLTLVGFAALIFQLALLGCQVWLLYGVMQVLRITTRWLWVLGACLPCIGLLVLLAINQKATAKLRSAGITVGFFGADLPRLPR